MEETLQEKVPAEVKAPAEEQGGIGPRLRDRELLRKRKAEAEERATNQWVYGAQSSKRAKKETNNFPRKKGRPRKTVPVKEPQPEVREAQEAGETLSPAEEMLPAPVPVSTLDSAYILASIPAPALDQPQIPAVASVPVPHTDVSLEMKPSSEALPRQVLIEDLGPDEEEDRALPPNQFVINQGGVEETSVIEVGEQNKVFPDTVFASSQPDALPGNLI
ncbi:Hemogen [Bagarius yarrelli]|uniref:Hemogen n=1 Tax=Bagarius yarrelli TaxID=175774 RepID=A0A556VUZ1_BAGYA|nr:Hemogen [Bagarius yarrelli]